MLLPLALPLALSMTGAESPIRLDGVLCHPSNLFVETNDTAELRLIASSGAKVVQTFPEIGYVLVEAPQGALQVTRKRLRTAFGYDRVELDRAGRIAYTPNDPLWPNMWHPTAINVDKAWDISLGPKKTIVAVLDTGVEITHSDLAANIYTNPNEIPDNSIDDDGNGYVDDVHGYDFTYGDNDPNDVFGHGTACAGLVAAVGDNGIGVIGIAPKATILPLKVATDAEGYFYNSATVPAYFYGQKMGAKVFSMSYYADSVSKAEGAALKWVANHGVLPIAAAGNDSTVYPFYPGAYEFVLSVAAVNPNLSKAGFSDYGSWVDVSAPGVGLVTTRTGNDFTYTFSGTSGACPIVAGLAALLYGIKPSATTTTIRKCIEESATLQDQVPYGEFSNYGFVNAQRAVQYLKGASFTPQSPKVRWISPVGSVDPAKNPIVNARVYGRNLVDATAEVAGVATIKSLAQKDFFDYRLPTTNGEVSVKVGGSPLATAQPPLPSGYVFPMIEASQPGGSIFGGYWETLRKDGATMMATRRGDGTIVLQGSFKNLPFKGAFWLVLDHRYRRTTTGIERLELYDWKTRSYPYASFVILLEQPVPTTLTRSRVFIPDISKYVDFDRNAYFKIETTDDLAESSELLIDTAYLKPA